jgi:NADPH:quinone reductase-like Zn-dependent oxidoreductase
LKNEGADIILNTSDPGFWDQFRKMSFDLNCTMMFDAVGGELLGKLLHLMPKNTIVYLYGSLAHVQLSNIHPLDLLFNNKTISGFYLYNWLLNENNRKHAYG